MVFRTKQRRGGRAIASVTGTQFAAYEGMFKFLNRRLFSGKLPPVLLNFSRLAKTYGFFAPSRWQKGATKSAEVRHEISLNPAWLRSRPAIEVASTLAHEMAHLWQQENGKPSRRGYHNAEWAATMDQIGLVPSSTGQPGGKRVGQRVSHYIAPGGPFAVAFREMPRKFLLPWTCDEPEKAKKEKKAKNKVKYTCPECSANVWGKPGLAIACLECEGRFQEEGGAEGEGAEGDEAEG
jgi:predicted SprT family Zn-dependent metalloprotease